MFDFESDEEFGTQQDEDEAPEWVHRLGQEVAHKIVLEEASKNAAVKSRKKFLRRIKGRIKWVHHP